MMKRSKIMLSIFAVFAALVISSFAVSAAGYTSICLRENEILHFSECNPDMEDYACTSDNFCQLCTNEIDPGVYCPASPNACQEACIYIYEAPDDTPEEDPLPLVLSNSPENNAEVEVGSVTFNFTVSPSTGLSECSLLIDGEKVKTNSIVRKENIIKYSLAQGIYEWRAECLESSGLKRTAKSETRTLYVGEESPNAPKKVILTSPATGARLTGAQEVSFTFDISDTILSGLTQCDLYINDASVSTITSLAATANEIKYTAAINDYTWKVKCGNYDSETRTLSIVAPSSGGGSSGGGSHKSSGGGGSGGGSSSTKGIAYAPTKTQIASGYTKEIKENDTIKFYISNNGTDEQHTITAKTVTGNTSMTLTVESEPINVVLNTGEEKKFDLTADGYYDLLIKLDSITNKKGNLTVQVINEQVPGEEEEETVIEEQTTTEPETTDIGATGASVGLIQKITGNKTVMIVGVVIIVIIILAIYFTRSEKSESKEKKE
jgi:hypothetical protein